MALVVWPVATRSLCARPTARRPTVLSRHHNGKTSDTSRDPGRAPGHHLRRIVDRSVIVLGTTPGVFVVRTDGEGERTFAYLTASLAMRSYDRVDRHRRTPFGAARVCGRGADGQD